MGKKIIIMMLIGLLLVSIVSATNYEFLMSPYTRTLDRQRSINQSDSSWIFGNVTADWYSWVVGDDWATFDGLTWLFNSVKLNATIDERASGLGDNASWNQSLADTLYADISVVSNPFDQVLNTTSNPTFNNQTITNCIVFGSGGSICSGS